MQTRTYTLQEALDLGLRHYHANDLPNARAIFLQITQTAPSSADAWELLGLCMHAQGDTKGAIEALRHALTLTPSAASLHANLGELLRIANAPHEAHQHLLEALRLDPLDSNTHYNLANLLKQQGALKEALHHYRAALNSTPDDWECLYNMGNTLLELGCYDEASCAFESAHLIKPQNSAIVNNLALAYTHAGAFVKAQESLQKAIALDPKSPTAYFNLGNLHRLCRQPKEAIAAFETSLKLDPSNPAPAINLAYLHLSIRDYAQGWRAYESRHALQQDAFEDLLTPRLTPGDLHGKRILVLNEQGFGDTLLFARFLAPLGKVTKTFWFLPQKELIPLFGDQIPQTLTTLELPSSREITVALGSLPWLLGANTPLEIPKAPYLRATTSLLLPYKEGLRVGLAWKSNPRFHLAGAKTLTLDQLLPLLEIQGVAWYSFQMGESASLDHLPIIDLAPSIRHFQDTAAFVAQMDLIISVDTALAHLAGALGKKVWILLPFDADWRWGLEGEKSDWYESATLFRQHLPHDYSVPLQALKDALLALLA